MASIKCPLSAYRNMFGAPGKGAHAYRFLGTAAVDYVLTIVGACITTFLMGIPLPLTTIAWFVVGVVCHVIFGVETSTLRFLGVKCA